MKNIFLLFLIALLVVASCTKTNNATNNIVTFVPPSKPAIAVNGVNDITFTNWFGIKNTLDLSVVYLDSVQEHIQLSLSALPSGIDIDTNWQKDGLPDFATSITLFDTTLKGATPGTYQATLTATSASGKTKSYPFNIKVLPMPTGFLGKYDNCLLSCDTTLTYADSVYMDPVIINKMWFINYGNSGQKIYGFINLPSHISVPAQVVGGHTYAGSGDFIPGRGINIVMGTTCVTEMY